MGCQLEPYFCRINATVQYHYGSGTGTVVLQYARGSGCPDERYSNYLLYMHCAN